MIYLDFETYYAADYGLKQISVLEYIKDPRFKIHGVGMADDTSDVIWLTQRELENYGIDWSKEIVVAHNVRFDGAILEWICDLKPKAYICTQAMALGVLGNTVKSHSLKSLAEHYGFPPKGEMKTLGKETLTAAEEQELADYCTRDVEICRELYKKLAEKFPKSQYEPMDWAVKCFVRPQLKLDKEVLQHVHAKEKERRETIFTNLGIDKSVFSSNKKFPELLVSRGYEIPTKKSSSTGKDIPALAVSDEGFLEMANSRNQELEELCEARIAAKSTILETRSEKFLRLADLGLWPFDIQFSGAKQTHRFSGSNGAGGNPQNLPKKSELRSAIGVPEGSSLIVGDFAAIELRIVSWLARESKLTEPITEGRDIYAEFASKVYKRPITKADVKERQFGKCAILGLGYGMGAAKFARTVKLQTGEAIDQKKAYEIVDLYRQTYSRIPALWALLESYISILARGGYFQPPSIPFLKFDRGEIVLPSGLTLKYPNLHKEPGEKRDEWVYEIWDKGHLSKRKLYGGKLLENISQALAGEITKQAVRLCQQIGINTVGTVHDELLAVILRELAEEKARQMQKAMETSPIWWPQLRLRAEVGYGQNWKEAKC